MSIRSAFLNSLPFIVTHYKPRFSCKLKQKFQKLAVLQSDKQKGQNSRLEAYFKALPNKPDALITKT